MIEPFGLAELMVQISVKVTALPHRIPLSLQE